MHMLMMQFSTHHIWRSSTFEKSSRANANFADIIFHLKIANICKLYYCRRKIMKKPDFRHNPHVRLAKLNSLG